MKYIGKAKEEKNIKQITKATVDLLSQNLKTNLKGIKPSNFNSLPYKM